MDPHTDIIPPPPIVRERLAASLRQTNLLRRLLRLSEKACEERYRQSTQQPSVITGREVITA